MKYAIFILVLSACVGNTEDEVQPEGSYHAITTPVRSIGPVRSCTTHSVSLGWISTKIEVEEGCKPLPPSECKGWCLGGVFYKYRCTGYGEYTYDVAFSKAAAYSNDPTVFYWYKYPEDAAGDYNQILASGTANCLGCDNPSLCFASEGDALN